jgi:DNA polymerase-3 subunit gamma/tau
MAMKVPMEELMRFMRTFSDLQNSMRYSTDKRTLFEMALIRAMKPQTETDLSGLISRIRSLEQQLQALAAGGTLPEMVQNSARAEVPAGADASGMEPVKEIRLAPAVYDDMDQLKKHWHEIIHLCGGAVGGFLEGTKPTYREELGFIVPFGDEFSMSQIARPERLEMLEQAAAKIMNKEIHFRLMLLSQMDGSVKLVKADTDLEHPGLGMDIGEE